MKEYYGDSAQQYGQPQDKYYTLFPSLEKALPIAESGQSAVDLGCGNGVLFEMVTKKGYAYTGVDISADMLTEAKKNNPDGLFIQGDVTKPIPELAQKFDVVISNMVIPSLGTKVDFEGVFMLAESLLSEKGIMIVTAGHPCFDGYMQKHFLKRDDIETDFEGYFQSGEVYKVHRALDNRTFTFTDFHWTLCDYYQCAQKAGLKIENLDECPVVGEPPQAVIDKFAKKGSPSYILFVLTKK